MKNKKSEQTQEQKRPLQILFVVLLAFLTFNTTVQAQTESGLLIGGGGGTFNHSFSTPIPADQIGKTFDEKYAFDLHLGYRFRIQQSKSFFWDMDALLGWENYQKAIYNGLQDGFVNYKEGERSKNLYMALSPTFNWQVYQGLYVGTGIVPTLYFYRSKDDNWHFDLPAELKLGYRFHHVSLEAACKINLLKQAQAPLLDRNRKTAFQLSLYLPLFNL
ncbi:MAG: hypothetical protein ACI30I_03570 [Parabacteroides sp.]